MLALGFSVTAFFYVFCSVLELGEKKFGHNFTGEIEELERLEKDIDAVLGAEE